MEDPLPYTSFSLTHVNYNPNDRVSYLCAWLAIVPQGLCVAYATLIYSSREIEILLMFAGQMACETVNFALKRIIKEERPKQMHGKGYGMPSSHAQFVTFFSVHLALFLLLRHTPTKTPKDSHNPFSLLQRVTLSIAALVSAGLVAGSRIYLNYHTPKQVLVGCTAGFICAVGWFCITTLFRKSGLLEIVLEFPLVRMFRVRDLVVEEDLPQCGWDKWEEKRALSHRSQSARKSKKR